MKTTEQEAREWWSSRHPGTYEPDEREVNIAIAFHDHMQAKRQSVDVERIMEVVDPDLDWSGGPMACKHRRIDLRTRLSAVLGDPWISVKDRLPEVNNEVFVWFANCTIPSTGQWTNAGKWSVPHEVRNYGPVTHWMPPTPPTVEP